MNSRINKVLVSVKIISSIVLIMSALAVLSATGVLIANVSGEASDPSNIALLVISVMVLVVGVHRLVYEVRNLKVK